LRVVDPYKEAVSIEPLTDTKAKPDPNITGTAKEPNEPNSIADVLAVGGQGQ